MIEYSTECKDWESRIIAGESLITFPPLFPEEANAALDVFKSLRVSDMPGTPTMGEVCRPWIFDFVACLFGSYDTESGRRLITEYLLHVSKKNFKSGLAAGIMVTALIRNWRPDGEFYIIAPTIEVASNSFLPARGMIKNDEELSDLFQVQDHLRQIKHRTMGSVLKVIAAENETVSGKKGIITLVDELHAFGKRLNAENMLTEATGGLAARPEGCTIYTTTQSDEPPSGIFRKKLMYARGVRDGKIKDNKFLPALYEFPDKLLKDNEHRNPKYFYITNPNLGASVDEEFLISKIQRAGEDGEESMIGVLAKHLNVEIGLNLRSDRWAGADYWEQQTDETITFESLLARCEVFDIGIDGGGLDDLMRPRFTP